MKIKTLKIIIIFTFKESEKQLIRIGIMFSTKLMTLLILCTSLIQYIRAKSLDPTLKLKI